MKVFSKNKLIFFSEENIQLYDDFNGFGAMKVY